MSELFAAVVSIAPTRRRRWLWAAWWTAPPSREPFRRPDAAQGGALSRAQALRAAEAAAGRPLVEIDGRWARAFARTLTGAPPWPRSDGDTAERPRPARGGAGPRSLWQVLGVAPSASIEEIRRAFQERALLLHPDHGGDVDAFRALRSAYEEALRRRQTQGPRRRRAD